ncbi:hypothetical protein HZS_7107 [Henneguya salminicola]|nr:hypothetical protein HZS_7107 [Henneguya salminicola]
MLSSLSEFASFNLSGKNLFHLSENAIKQVEDSHQSIKVDISNNYLTDIPMEIKHFPFMEHLNVSYNLLNSTSNLCSLNFLSILNISHNELSSIEAVCEIKTLKILDFSYNKIQKIPKNINELKSLEKLYCQSNRISHIDDNFYQLFNLRTADFKNNCLLNISKNIINLRNIEYLDFSINYISFFDALIFNLNSLRFFAIDNNPISFPPPCVCVLGVNAIKHFLMTKYNNIENSYIMSPIILRNSVIYDSYHLRSHTPSLQSVNTPLENLDEPEIVQNFRNLIQQKLNINIPFHISFFEFISDGVALCKLVKKYDKNLEFTIFIQSGIDSKLNVMQKTHNISQFLSYCIKNLLPCDNLCSTDQILSGENHQEIINTLTLFFDYHNKKTNQTLTP